MFSDAPGVKFNLHNTTSQLKTLPRPLKTPPIRCANDCLHIGLDVDVQTTKFLNFLCPITHVYFALGKNHSPAVKPLSNPCQTLGTLVKTLSNPCQTLVKLLAPLLKTLSKPLSNPCQTLGTLVKTLSNPCQTLVKLLAPLLKPCQTLVKPLSNSWHPC